MRGDDLESSPLQPAKVPLLPASSLEEEVEPDEGPEAGTSTSLQATFNMVNIFMGLGLLSMPWAMQEAGWLGMLSLLLAVGVFALSGSLLVRSLKFLPPGSTQTYPELGVAAFGKAGRYVIGCFAVSEFFGGSCGMLVVMWQELASFLPPGGLGGLGPTPAAALLATLLTVPGLLIPSFRRLSWLSVAGCASTVLILLAVVATCAADPLRHHQPVQPPASHSWARWGIMQATGVFAVSVSGHSSLPALRRSLKRPQDFDWVLLVAFGFMFAIYGAVAGLGYAYWGDKASVLITTDLMHNSVFSGVTILGTGLSVDAVVRLCILVNAFTTYPCIVLVIQDMLWAMLPQPLGDHWRGHHLPTACRLLVLALGCGVAWLARDSLGAVLSLVGGFCSITCSLLFPALCYLLLGARGGRLTRGHRAALVGLLVVGTLTLVLIVGQDVWGLLGVGGRRTGDAGQGALEGDLLGPLWGKGQEIGLRWPG